MHTAAAELPDLEEKTHFLLSPDNYPEETTSVTVVDTHMARVFLTDDFVYKMKKPVCFSYLDFSSLDKRYRVCSEELRLNRRLTDDVYLEVAPLLLTGNGQLALSGSGTPVEWLVKMKRLREKDCLPQQIRTLSGKALMPLLLKLKDFYRRAIPLALSATQYLELLRERIAKVHSGLREPILALDGDEVDKLAAALLDFTHTHQALLGARAEQGHIIEGHGDLRPEHCFLSTPPQVIDCLEFNRDLRCIDALDDLCYLALECELLERPDLCTLITGSYSDDGAPDPALVRFYQCYRALLRAQLAAAHLLDQEVVTPDKWRHKTRMYLDAAERHLPPS